MVGSDGTDDDDAAPLFFDMAACTAVRRTRTRTVAQPTMMIGRFDRPRLTRPLLTSHYGLLRTTIVPRLW